MPEIDFYLRKSGVRPKNPEMTFYTFMSDISGNMSKLVLKNIHDRMNREGFEVENAKGMKWRTYGDGSLAKATETQRVAALAVFLSRQQIVRAHAGEKPDPAEIEALMPNDKTIERATAQAIRYIPEAAQAIETLLYAQRGLAPTLFGRTLGTFLKWNLEAIGHPGRERQIQQLEETSRQIGMPLLRPTLTPLKW